MAGPRWVARAATGWGMVELEAQQAELAVAAVLAAVAAAAVTAVAAVMAAEEEPVGHRLVVRADSVGVEAMAAVGLVAAVTEERGAAAEARAAAVMATEAAARAAVQATGVREAAGAPRHESRNRHSRCQCSTWHSRSPARHPHSSRSRWYSPCSCPSAGLAHRCSRR